MEANRFISVKQKIGIATTVHHCGVSLTLHNFWHQPMIYDELGHRHEPTRDKTPHRRP